ncbi:MAG: hypothetical protein SPH68_04380 [Candidatus Borkfalkiaceae bacterium]|nr:hypothetical protein [Clostridia bacterium]MDY6223377.1 hypothetical protein [Christensenellaceae bacterium]
MKIRFLSSVPCCLCIDGKYSGVTDTFDRFDDVRLKDNLFACFTPQNGLPLGVFLNERLFFSPPEGVEAYLLRDGAAVYARDFPPRSPDTRVVAQERFAADLITVYFQGGLFVSFETPAGFYVSPLPLRYESARISKRGDLYFIEGKNALCVFNAQGKKIFDETVLSFSYESGTLRCVLPLHGGGNRTLSGEWALTNNDCYPISKTIEGNAKSAHRAYDFFENFRIGADVSAFLSRDLQEKIAQLRLFLGDFVYAFPCDNENECGVIRKKGERLFEADYYTAEFSEGVIVDFKKA